MKRDNTDHPDAGASDQQQLPESDCVNPRRRSRRPQPEPNEVQAEESPVLKRDYSRFVRSDSQDFLEGYDDDQQVQIAARKPAKEWFVRTSQSEEYWQYVDLLRVKDHPELNGFWLVEPSLHRLVLEEPGFTTHQLVLYATTFDEFYLWPIKVGTRVDEWNKAARTIARRAKEEWVRVVPGSNGYRAKTAPTEIAEPVWPEKDFCTCLSEAFNDRLIDDANHEVLVALGLSHGQ